jgi:hypothetical protein
LTFIIAASVRRRDSFSVSPERRFRLGEFFNFLSNLHPRAVSFSGFLFFVA